MAELPLSEPFIASVKENVQRTVLLYNRHYQLQYFNLIFKLATSVAFFLVGVCSYGVLPTDVKNHPACVIISITLLLLWPLLTLMVIVPDDAELPMPNKIITSPTRVAHNRWWYGGCLIDLVPLLEDKDYINNVVTKRKERASASATKDIISIQIDIPKVVEYVLESLVIDSNVKYGKRICNMYLSKD